MTTSTRDVLLRQLDTAWRLASHHLHGLTTEECLWSPAARGPRLRMTAPGVWHAEEPEHERYDLGPASIGWVSWHLGYWWSMVLDHSFGDATLSAASVRWPGTGPATVDWIAGCHGRWRASLASLPAEEMASAERTRWPFQHRPFSDVVAWVNMELTKNAAEIGYGRFLFAVRDG